jgi:hypothetical protein
MRAWAMAAVVVWAVGCGDGSPYPRPDAQLASDVNDNWLIDARPEDYKECIVVVRGDYACLSTYCCYGPQLRKLTDCGRNWYCQSCGVTASTECRINGVDYPCLASCEYSGAMQPHTAPQCLPPYYTDPPCPPP